MQRSPYTPGTIAREVFGRDQYLIEMRRDAQFMKVGPEFGGRISVIMGPRGIGKTSLLRSMEGIAKELNFETTWITGGDGDFIPSLIQATGIKARNGLSPSRTLQAVISAAGESVVDSGKAGLVVFIDEVQEADLPGLKALAYAWQQLQSEASDLPIMAVAAGLNHALDVLTTAASFAERYRYFSLSTLPPKDAALALTQPAMRNGVTWNEGALDEAIDLAQGYPYSIQVIGDAAWNAQGLPDEGDQISKVAVDKAKNEFEQSLHVFHRARWMKATEAEKDLLIAMANLGDGPQRRAAVAKEMNVESSALSVARDSLIDKGLIEATGHGLLSFTAPGFAEFIREQQE